MSRIMLKYTQEKQKKQMINICIVERARLWRKKDLDLSQLSNFFAASEFYTIYTIFFNLSLFNWKIGLITPALLGC